jgi:hypothetical protein
VGNKTDSNGQQVCPRIGEVECLISRESPRKKEISTTKCAFFGFRHVTTKRMKNNTKNVQEEKKIK